MPDDSEKNRHFILSGVTQTEAFRAPGSGRKSELPPERDRPSHGGALLSKIHRLAGAASEARRQQEDAGITDGIGLQVEFESFPNIKFAFESLACEASGIELLNVRHTENTTAATVFVPDGKLDHFERLINDYLAEKKDKNGKARDNRRLIGSSP